MVVWLDFAVLTSLEALDRGLLDYVIWVVDRKALDVVVDDARVAKVAYIHEEGLVSWKIHGCEAW